MKFLQVVPNAVTLGLSIVLVVVSGCGQNRESPSAPTPAVVSSGTSPTEKISSTEATNQEQEQEEAGSEPGNSRMALSVITGLTFKDPVVKAGQALELVPMLSVTNADTVTFECQWFVNDEAVTGNGLVLPAEYVKKGARLRARVTASVNGQEDAPYFSKDIVVPNSPPRFVSEPELQFRGDDYQYTVVAEDPDGDELRYALDNAPSGMAIDAKTGKVTWEIGNRQAGQYVVRISARDKDGMSAVQEYQLAVTIEQTGVEQ